MMEHMRVAEQKKQAKVQGRIEELAEEKRESLLNEEQLKENKNTAIAMRKSQIQNNIEAIENVKRERANTKSMEK